MNREALRNLLGRLAEQHAFYLKAEHRGDFPQLVAAMAARCVLAQLIPMVLPAGTAVVVASGDLGAFLSEELREAGVEVFDLQHAAAARPAPTAVDPDAELRTQFFFWSAAREGARNLVKGRKAAAAIVKLASAEAALCAAAAKLAPKVLIVSADGVRLVNGPHITLLCPFDGLRVVNNLGEAPASPEAALAASRFWAVEVFGPEPAETGIYQPDDLPGSALVFTDRAKCKAACRTIEARSGLACRPAGWPQAMKGAAR